MFKLAATAAAAVLLAATGGAADEVVCPLPLGSAELCAGVPAAIANTVSESYPNPVQIDEIEAGDLLLGGNMFEPNNVTFVFEADGGDFQFCFGFCQRSKIPRDLWNQFTAAEDEATLEPLRQQIAEICVGEDEIDGSRRMIFDDRNENPGATYNIPEYLNGFDPVIFWLIPDMKFAEINIPGLYADDTARRPLFSFTKLNRQQNDHFILFRDDSDDADVENTLFIWEDKDRSSFFANDPSDNDFGDLTFSVNIDINPLVPPFFCAADDGDSNPCTDASASNPTGTSVTLAWNGSPVGIICD